MKRRIISLFIVLALCLSLYPGSAVAAVKDNTNDIYIVQDENHEDIRQNKNQQQNELPDQCQNQDQQQVPIETENFIMPTAETPEDHGRHTDWTAVTDTTTALTAGKYYLDNAVTVSALTVTGEVTLCLNGQIMGRY